MRLIHRLLLVLLCLPTLVWGQAELINGNRVHAGWVNYGTTAGSATAYTLTFTPAFPGHVPGECFLLKPHVTNTGPASLNVQGLGALAMTKLSGSALVPLVAGDLPLGRLVLACHDGTNLQLIGTAQDSSGTGITNGDKGDITVSGAGDVWTIDPGTVTYAKLQPISATARVLGRISPGAGPTEELTIAQVKSMLGLSFGDLTGTATDAQIPNLNVLSTGLTPSRCVETDASGLLISSGTLCGTSGGGTGFSAITGGTNTTAAMVVGTGASLGPTGTGQITATAMPASGLSGVLVPAQLPNAAADGVTKGAVMFAATDFNCTAGLCSIDYTNAQVASSGTKGFLTAADWTTFNGKQAALGFTPENVANKSTDATLGLSNTFYPSQGAVKTYIDSGVKALTNTALTPRQCNGANTATITINADNLTGCDFVQVAELSQTTTFDLTAGTYVNGQFLTILVFTTVQRSIIFTTGAGKFVAHGVALPTFTKTADYTLYGFRYNALANRWAFVASTQDTNYGTAGYVRTAGGPGVESSWQPPAGGGVAGTIGDRLLPVTAVGFPATDAAVLDLSENNPRLLFDNAVRKCIFWGPFRMNPDYTSTPVLKFQYSMTSVTGAVGVAIDVEVMAVTPGDASDPNDDSNYGPVNTCADTPVASVAGRQKEISCALTNNDSLAAGDLTKIRLCRNVAHATDNAAGIMEGLVASLLYTR